MESDKFCLHWNDFAANISSSLRELRHEADLYDVTLACEDDSVKAHKLILSACSPFFRNIFKTWPHSHPLLYLRGIRGSQLTAILNFIYHGEVNVAQEDLKSFLGVAEDLKIKGLTEQKDSHNINIKSDGGSSSQSSLPPLPPLQQHAPVKTKNAGISSNFQSGLPSASQSKKKALANHFLSQNRSIAEDDDDVQEVETLRIQSSHSLAPGAGQEADLVTGPGGGAEESLEALDYYEAASHPEAGTSEDIDLSDVMGDGVNVDGNKDDIIDAMIESILVRRSHPEGGTMYECSVCQKLAKKKDKMQAHAEIHLRGFSHKCNFCGKHYKTRPSLKVHISTSHKEAHMAAKQMHSMSRIGIESILG